jgi:acetyltransferase-like isoleucine patch superfamily enzyme
MGVTMKQLVKHAARLLLSQTSAGRTIVETGRTQTPVSPFAYIRQRVLGLAGDVYWPVHSSSLVQMPKRIWIGIETSPGLMPGCYLQGTGSIVIGDYTQIGPNVGLISSNHNTTDTRLSQSEPILIGAYSWLGMGSTVLAGVRLGRHTVVAAGAVVTKSFPGGHCVLAGVPAKPIRNIEKHQVVHYAAQHKYHGFIPHDRFGAFCAAALEPEVCRLAEEFRDAHADLASK